MVNGAPTLSANSKTIYPNASAPARSGTGPRLSPGRPSPTRPFSTRPSRPAASRRRGDQCWTVHIVSTSRLGRPPNATPSQGVSRRATTKTRPRRWGGHSTRCAVPHVALLPRQLYPKRTCRSRKEERWFSTSAMAAGNRAHPVRSCIIAPRRQVMRRLTRRPLTHSNLNPTEPSRESPGNGRQAVRFTRLRSVGWVSTPGWPRRPRFRAAPYRR